MGLPQPPGTAGKRPRTRNHDRMVIRVGSGLLVRDGCVLLVASRYANLAQPAWGLPGGRQRAEELLPETVVREVAEETGLAARAGELLYVAESYVRGRHVTCVTFAIEAAGQPRVPTRDGEHIAGVAFVPIEALGERIAAAVVREPLQAWLRGELTSRYAGFRRADVWFDLPDDV